MLLRFNKSQTDFSTDEDWFNYQEQIEDHSESLYSVFSSSLFRYPSDDTELQPWHAVLSLVEGQNVQHTEAAIEEYRKANYDSIVANDARKVMMPQLLHNAPTLHCLRSRPNMQGCCCSVVGQKQQHL